MFRMTRTTIELRLLNGDDKHFLCDETWCSMNIQPRDVNRKSFIKVSNGCTQVGAYLVPLQSCCRIFKSVIYPDKIA